MLSSKDLERREGQGRGSLDSVDTKTLGTQNSGVLVLFVSIQGGVVLVYGGHWPAVRAVDTISLLGEQIKLKPGYNAKV